MQQHHSRTRAEAVLTVTVPFSRHKYRYTGTDSTPLSPAVRSRALWDVSVVEVEELLSEKTAEVKGRGKGK